MSIETIKQHFIELVQARTSLFRNFTQKSGYLNVREWSEWLRSTPYSRIHQLLTHVVSCTTYDSLYASLDMLTEVVISLGNMELKKIGSRTAALRMEDDDEKLMDAYWEIKTQADESEPGSIANALMASLRAKSFLKDMLNLYIAIIYIQVAYLHFFRSSALLSQNDFNFEIVHMEHIRSPEGQRLFQNFVHLMFFKISQVSLEAPIHLRNEIRSLLKRGFRISPYIGAMRAVSVRPVEKTASQSEQSSPSFMSQQELERQRKIAHALEKRLSRKTDHTKGGAPYIRRYYEEGMWHFGTRVMAGVKYPPNHIFLYWSTTDGLHLTNSINLSSFVCAMLAPELNYTELPESQNNSNFVTYAPNITPLEATFFHEFIHYKHLLDGTHRPGSELELYDTLEELMTIHTYFNQRGEKLSTTENSFLGLLRLPPRFTHKGLFGSSTRESILHELNQDVRPFFNY